MGIEKRGGEISRIKKCSGYVGKGRGDVKVVIWVFFFRREGEGKGWEYIC